MIVADTTGKQLGSFPLVPRQTAEGWVNGSTLLFSDRGDTRRLRSYSIADGSRQLLDDSVDPITEATWSPDGTMISSIRCSASACQLRLNRADGTPRESIDLPDRLPTRARGRPISGGSRTSAACRTPTVRDRRRGGDGQGAAPRDRPLHRSDARLAARFAGAHPLGDDRRRRDEARVVPANRAEWHVAHTPRVRAGTGAESGVGDGLQDGADLRRR